MSISRLVKVLLVICIAGGSVWLQNLMDDGLGISWPQNVVRNWEEFGFFQLHGKLVTNPGGFEATSHPDIYKGMSPVCLYPPFFSDELLGWTGLGMSSFHFLLALASFWAIWSLLGQTGFAFAVASAAILCPGYGRWQKLLDPNAISVLFGLPYMAVATRLLKRPKMDVMSMTSLLLLTVAFVSLNWTTAWALGPAILMLWGLREISRRNVAAFVIMAGASSMLIVFVSVVAKAGAPHASGHSSLFDMLGSYGWGNTGYGVDMTVGKAFTRLIVVNLAGLLPLFFLLAWSVATSIDKSISRLGGVLSPIMFAALELAAMRNYFGHHPWMAAPVLLAGLIFSLVLARSPALKAPPAGRGHLLPLAGTALLCFFYGLAVIIFFRANETNQLALLNLIRHHTARPDWILVVKDIDPGTAKLAPRFDELFDRHVQVAEDRRHLPRETNSLVILSAVPIQNGVNLLAQTSAGTSPDSALYQITGWFNKTIARRRPGDRMDLGAEYFLYKPAP